ncbi:MAG: hypothetical protein IPH36_19690 [Saprospiraceae bacterium]|nr:hypothetical protein [Saprospiraceae bacterium]
MPRLALQIPSPQSSAASPPEKTRSFFLSFYPNLTSGLGISDGSYANGMPLRDNKRGWQKNSQWQYHSSTKLLLKDWCHLCISVYNANELSMGKSGLMR